MDLRTLARSHGALQLEILALRHQLEVLQRIRPRRVRLAKTDRWLWDLLAQLWTGWRTAVLRKNDARRDFGVSRGLRMATTRPCHRTHTVELVDQRFGVIRVQRAVHEKGRIDKMPRAPNATPSPNLETLPNIPSKSDDGESTRPHVGTQRWRCSEVRGFANATIKRGSTLDARSSGRAPFTSVYLADRVVDVLQQPIDRGPAPRCIGLRPPIRAKACPRLSFRLFSEVSHRGIDNRDTCAFNDGVPGAQNPRRPCGVALEYRRGGKRDQRVDEREPVMELPDACETFTHKRDCVIAVPAPHRQDGANIQPARPYPCRRRQGRARARA